MKHVSKISVLVWVGSFLTTLGMILFIGLCVAMIYHAQTTIEKSGGIESTIISIGKSVKSIAKEINEGDKE